MSEETLTLINASAAKTIVEGFLSSTKETTSRRVSQFKKYEVFVSDNDQWDMNDLPDGDKPALTFNQCEDYVNTYLAKLFPRNPETGALEIGVKVKEKDKEKKEQYETEILSVYEDSSIAEILLEQGQNFLIGGDGCLYFPRDPLTNRAKIISLNPTSVYLGWKGSKLEQFAFEDEISLAEAELQKKDNWLISAIKTFLGSSQDADAKFKKVTRLTYWDANHQIIKIENQFEVRKNQDGFIPFAWVPNKPKAHSHEGRSEAKSLFDLEKQYNERSSDFAERVKSNTKAVLATYSELDATKLDRDEMQGILAMNQGDKAEFLHLTENKEVLEFIDMIERKMDKKMAINDAVNGQIKSNVSSLAMMYYFSPLLDRIGLKRVYWDTALRELNKAILFYKFGANIYRTEPIYQPVMMVDTESKIKNTILLLENRLISHKDAIDILRGSENSIEKFNEIKTEFGELAKIDGFLTTKKATPTQAA